MATLFTDLRGISRLAIDAVTGVTQLVEAVHANIARLPGPIDAPSEARTTGITGLVYRSIGGVTRLVGSGIDVALAQLAPLVDALPETPQIPGREPLLAVLNGVLGDYLEASGNSLAIAMRLRRDGKPLALQRDALAAAIPHATGRLVVLIHGLCMGDLGWSRDGHDHGQKLDHELGCTPVYLHYNTGRHVSTNGRDASALLEELVEQWPVPVDELTILGHSMGGLIARSACHYAQAEGRKWPTSLRRLIMLGTPHHGAPLERIGNLVDLVLGASPYTAAFSKLGKVRSAGITDLRYGNVVDEDWAGRDRFAHGIDRRHPVPLPPGVACYAIAGTAGRQPYSPGAHLLGDGLVQMASALGHHEDPARELGIPEARQWVAIHVRHLELLSDAGVYERIRQWMTPG
jgi:pimeloyl-ACP methyl ester carboxylesterase